MALPLLLGAGLIGQLISSGQDRKRQARDQRAAQQQMGQQASDAITGAGFQMGPRVGADPAQQQQLGAIARNIASPVQDIRGMAMDQLGSLSESSQIALARDKVALNREQLQLAAEMNPAGATTDPKMLADLGNQLRDERRADLAPYVSRLQSFDELSAALQSNSGPASMAALFKFISALDDSVVRDSEGRLLSTSSGPIRALVNYFNQVQGGGMFGPETKREIMEVATGVAQAQYEAAKEINKRHDGLTARYAETFLMPQLEGLTQAAGFNPNRTFAPVPGPARADPGGSKVTERDGDTVTIIRDGVPVKARKID